MEHRQFGRQVALDELFDLTLFQKLHALEAGEVRGVLSRLITTEARHVAFWQALFGLQAARLDVSRRVKLALCMVLRRLFGSGMTYLLLEAIEIYGIQKYLLLWEHYRQTDLAEKMRGILQEEFAHEDELVAAATGRKIRAEDIRNVFLGVNDGLVEVLGSVAGLFASLGNPLYVLVASIAIAVAGSISMAAGVFVSSGSQREVERIQHAKREFCNATQEVAEAYRPVRAALLVGVSYLCGALCPIFPVLLGAESVLWPTVFGALMVMGVSAVLSLLSGMGVGRRVLHNLLFVFGAIAATYSVGVLVRTIWSINI
jgi:VIT1/CCC1 family predicted Fe2+/Mn2+ transporter